MRRASRMLLKPTVRASLGTLFSPKKSLATPRRVTASSVQSLVLLRLDENGSLNPIWPFIPMPRRTRSKPPHSSIASSNLKQCASSNSSAMLPSKQCICWAGKFTCWTKCSRNQAWCD